MCTVAALAVNMVIAGVVLWFSGLLLKILGGTGTMILSKLSSLLLAAIGIMIVRKGVVMFVTEALNGRTRGL